MYTLQIVNYLFILILMGGKSRKLVSLIKARISEPSPLIQVVVGPRQVGKTTAVKTVIGERGTYETADSPVPLPAHLIEGWWAQAAKTAERLLAIDEVQKIPGWSEVVKKLWDQQPLKLIVTGSSALLVEKGLKETLAGRFELIRAEHWNFAEAQEIFGMSIDQYLEFGCYPGSIRFLKDVERWSSYIKDSIVEPALGRDLLQLHPIDQPALLRQLFGVAVSLPAQIVSLQKICGQLQHKSSVPTIGQYLDLLQDAFVVTGVQKYSPSPFRSKKSSPKLVTHDNALIRAFTRPVTDSISAELRGRYFENIVGARFIEAGWDTFYWKDRDREVDYVVIGPKGEKWAVEVKSGLTTQSEFSGLVYFCERNPEFKPCLISFNDQIIDGVTTIPASEILSLSRSFSS